MPSWEESTDAAREQIRQRQVLVVDMPPPTVNYHPMGWPVVVLVRLALPQTYRGGGYQRAALELLKEQPDLIGTAITLVAQTIRGDCL